MPTAKNPKKIPATIIHKAAYKSKIYLILMMLIFIFD
jgi:hypothetical protein